MNTNFEVKISHMAWDQETGKDKKVKETYVIDAFNYTEAESIITKIILEDKLKDVTINGIKPIKIREIFLDKDGDSTTDDGKFWYTCKIAFVVAVKEDGTKKTKKENVLIKGIDIKDALENLKLSMTETVDDWDSVAISSTSIYQVVLK